MSRIFIGLALAASLVACVDSSDQTSATGDHTFTMGDRTVMLKQGPSSDPPIASFLDPGSIDGSCWVTLQWCSEPGTGDAVCTFTDCTISRAVDACESLISDHC